MGSVIITLPWPDKRLSPNARVHWGALATAKKKARELAHLLTMEARGGWRHDGGNSLPMRVRISPPDRRLRDDDNMIAMLKAYRDGIADGLGVNDRIFAPEYQFCEPVKGGQIIVEIGA